VCERRVARRRGARARRSVRVEGIWGGFPNSRGVVKTNLEKKLVAVVGLLIQIVNKIVSQSRGNMELFLISSGGGQFTFVPLTLWYKFATRGCRWICYSNCKQNRSKASNIFEFLFAFACVLEIKILGNVTG
jgi:hypothetical protein